MCKASFEPKLILLLFLAVLLGCICIHCSVNAGELGSGGRTIGELVAKQLGVPFYDKALIKGLQDEFHLGTEEIEQLKGRSHNWWADFKRSMSIGYKMAQSQYHHNGIIEEPDFLTTDRIFKSETQILEGIAADESCVVAGRSGFYVFRNHPNHISILIQAPREQRIARLMEKRSISHAEAEKTIRKVDEMRENYVQRYTNSSRYDTRNYDLVINMNGLTEEKAAAIILQYIS